ncbi:hypothetical protein KAR91_55635 [Candidatus Pacearchaeota archaeon]|nr:hypothetical protein [Candidatus Pacearchaeota archaeon]
MVKEFKKKLKANGQSLKWFYDTHIKDDDNISLTYGGFNHQLNGYSTVSENVGKKLAAYTEGD